MIWWLRVHRTVALLGLTTAVTVLSIGLGPIGMLFPSFGGGAPFAMIPVAAVGPLVLAIAAGASISRGPFPAPARRTDLLEASTVLVVIGLVCAISTVGLAVGANPAVSLAMIRNTIAFCALAMASRAVLGDRYQSVPGVLYLLVAGLFGRGTPDHPAVWAGVVTTNTELIYWLFVAPILIVAAVGRSARRVGAWGNSN
ncbi:hypothetical protein [Curtobacterium flaccumfaciens]|uniref:hypothetical protein n=1 Tax=Curtobacterium flaccumfaciens TaxID=2035 RepID=UPI00136749CD|nr:hypothetical protein [Curtobacterium flaccumfaciens]MBT1667368.1 hypothetical protein [Curtobacterium flaccumfaciens pv. flaccumfaciens]QHN63573.1 hypothetical protein GBG65_20815 [Curtobacterium flaccumfaciens pv. flaccumfaciens]